MSKSVILTCFLWLISFILMGPFTMARGPISGGRYEQLSGTRKGADLKYLWDKKYEQAGYIYGKDPAPYLAENFHYLPAGGLVLDMGMGEGRNAIFLAKKGFKVLGVDISSVAVKKALLLAKENKVHIDTVVANLKSYQIKDESLDAIVCFYYVERSLLDKMKRWLRPGGVLIFEAYTDNQKKIKGFERYNEQFLVRPGELLGLFPGMRILKYEEPLHQKSFRASIILQKL